MRRFFLPFLFLPLFLLFASCDRDSVSQYTPTIYVYSMISGTDTLSVFSTTNGFVMDTIAVGDTVVLTAGFYSYTNNLTGFTISHTAEAATIQYQMPEEVDALLSSAGSSYERGVFYVPLGYNYVGFEFKYIALAPSNDAALTFTISSDSKFSSNSLLLKTPIKTVSDGDDNADDDTNNDDDSDESTEDTD